MAGTVVPSTGSEGAEPRLLPVNDSWRSAGVLRSQALGAFNRILTGLLQFLQVAVAARTLGPAAFGEYSVIWGVTSVCLGVASGVVWTPFLKFSAGLQGDEGSAPRAFMLLLGAVSYCAVSVVGTALWMSIAPNHQGPALRSYLLLVPLLLLSRLYYDYARCVFMGEGALGRMLAIDMVFNVGLFLLFLGFSVLGESVSVVLLLTAHILAGGMASLFGLSQHRPTRSPSGMRPGEDLGRFAAVSGANALLLYLYSQADVLLAGLVLAPAGVGLYSGGRTFVRAGYMAIEATNAMSLATSSRLVNKRNVSDLFRYVASLVVAGWCVTVPIAVVVAMAAPTLTKVVFGPAFESPAPIAAILCVGLPLLAVSSPTAAALDALGRPAIPLLAKIAGLGAMLLVWSLLSGASDGRGIAWASVSGIAVIALVQGCGFVRTVSARA